MIKTLRCATLAACSFSVSAAGNAASVTAVVATSAGAPVAEAVVSLLPRGDAGESPAARAVLVQENMQFIPYILPVRVGTTVEFPNHDPFRHHVYSFSQAKPFELKLYGEGETQSVVFDKEGVVILGCNIHDNMIAYIYVTAAPYFATTDKAGSARVEALPPGAYTVKVWHPQQRTGSDVSGEITVTGNADAEIKLALDLRGARRQRRPGAVDENAY